MTIAIERCADAIETVRRDGCVSLPGDEVWSGADLLALQSAGEQFLGEALSTPDAYVSEKKPFLLTMAPGPEHPARTLFGAAKALAMAICDTPVTCFTQRLWVIRPTASEHVWSQLWHRDHEARQIIKIFLHLSDVSIENGPFQYVRGSSGQRDESLCRFAVRTPTHRLGAYANPSIEMPSARIDTYAVQARTAVIADTTGIHRGGRLTSGHRLQMVWGFIPKAGE